jgi:DNA invertase Pin-like site-specific DNA recombinase
MQSLHGSAISEFPQVSDKNALWGELNVAKAKLYVKVPEPQDMGCFFKSSGGKAQIVSAVAEFEKHIIKERVIASKVNARRKGKRLVRLPVADELYQRAKELRRQRFSFRKIGQTLKIDEGTIRKRMKIDMKIRI